MLPKEILKYAEKVEDVEAAVMEEIKKGENQPAPAQPWIRLAGQILQPPQWDQILLEQQRELERQALSQQAQQQPRGFLGRGRLW